jgi:hypothetical protein
MEKFKKIQNASSNNTSFSKRYLFSFKKSTLITLIMDQSKNKSKCNDFILYNYYNKG